MTGTTVLVGSTALLGARLPVPVWVVVAGASEAAAGVGGGTLQPAVDSQVLVVDVLALMQGEPSLQTRAFISAAK